MKRRKLLDENIKKITLILLFITSIFVLIAVILINSSIRLSIYSKRFLIKTMQLVGATKSFVRKPFIWNHVRLGIISSIVSLIALSIIIVQLDNYLPELKIFQEANELIFLFIGTNMGSYPKPFFPKILYDILPFTFPTTVVIFP